MHDVLNVVISGVLGWVIFQGIIKLREEYRIHKAGPEGFETEEENGTPAREIDQTPMAPVTTTIQVLDAQSGAVLAEAKSMSVLDMGPDPIREIILNDVVLFLGAREFGGRDLTLTTESRLTSRFHRHYWGVHIKRIEGITRETEHAHAEHIIFTESFTPTFSFLSLLKTANSADPTRTWLERWHK